MTAPRFRHRRAALVTLSALLLARPALAGDEGPPAEQPSSEQAPAETPPRDAPHAMELGLEGRAFYLSRAGAAFAEESPFAVGAAAFVRRGWLHAGLSGDVQKAQDSDFGWRRPGETLITRDHTTLSAELGVSIPGTTLGRRWFWRHVRLDVLAMGGVERIVVREDLGGGGVGNQRWRRAVPYLGLRVGPRLRIGRAFGGHVGVAAWWRHPLRHESVRSVTGRTPPATGDTVGLMLFTGGSLAWE